MNKKGLIKKFEKTGHLYPEKHSAHGDPVLAMAGQVLLVQHAVAHWSDTNSTTNQKRKKCVWDFRLINMVKKLVLDLKRFLVAKIGNVFFKHRFMQRHFFSLRQVTFRNNSI